MALRTRTDRASMVSRSTADTSTITVGVVARHRMTDARQLTVFHDPSGSDSRWY
ncbi:hypothetical protein [Streptomyces sp. NPDC018045]|uniref:hypothetical protein n=1 Tax=Streptomyces sp. NPDC018045 TaxID=3365037 RepID=UPI0037A34E29